MFRAAEYVGEKGIGYVQYNQAHRPALTLSQLTRGMVPNVSEVGDRAPHSLDGREWDLVRTVEDIGYSAHRYSRCRCDITDFSRGHAAPLT